MTILWRVRIPFYKKIALACIFSITIFTIAVTLVRATIHHGRVASDNTQSQNIGWVWFWLAIEFSTCE